MPQTIAPGSPIDLTSLFGDEIVLEPYRFPPILSERLLETIQDHVLLTDREGVILYVNGAFEAATGYTREEAVGRTPRILKSEHQDAAYYRRMWERLLAGETFSGRILNRRKNGEIYMDERGIRPLRHADGSLRGFLSVGREVSGTVVVDPLTSLPKRCFLEDRIRELLARRREAGAEQSALVVMDLRRLSGVNAIYGYRAGDRVLGMAARQLRDIARDNPRIDTLAYLGSGNFAALIEGIEDEAEAGQMARMFQAALAQPIRLADDQMILQTAVGLAIVGDHAWGPVEILAEAEAALRHAKAERETEPVVFDHGRARRSGEALKLASDLQRALDCGEITAYYQPIHRIADGGLIGFEALARWITASGEIIPPDRFIPVAESSGLIVPIGDVILRQACQWAQAWQARFGLDLKISVNLSAHQFQLDDLVERIVNVLGATGLSPELLKLEITESAVVDDVERVVERMQELRDLGIELLIDDFGTGYSSLSQLTQYPIDILKIDKSFVSEFDREAQMAAVVDAVVALARGLGFKLIAEGVETPDQLRRLDALGCEMAQGYLFGKPMPPEDVVEHLAEHVPARPVG